MIIRCKPGGLDGPEDTGRWEPPRRGNLQRRTSRWEGVSPSVANVGVTLGSKGMNIPGAPIVRRIEFIWGGMGQTTPLGPRQYIVRNSVRIAGGDELFGQRSACQPNLHSDNLKCWNTQTPGSFLGRELWNVTVSSHGSSRHGATGWSGPGCDRTTNLGRQSRGAPNKGKPCLACPTWPAGSALRLENWPRSFSWSD